MREREPDVEIRRLQAEIAKVLGPRSSLAQALAFARGMTSGLKRPRRVSTARVREAIARALPAERLPP